MERRFGKDWKSACPIQWMHLINILSMQAPVTPAKLNCVNVNTTNICSKCTEAEATTDSLPCHKIISNRLHCTWKLFLQTSYTTKVLITTLCMNVTGMVWHKTANDYNITVSRCGITDSKIKMIVIEMSKFTLVLMLCAVLIIMLMILLFSSH